MTVALVVNYFWLDWFTFPCLQRPHLIRYATLNTPHTASHLSHYFTCGRGHKDACYSSDGPPDMAMQWVIVWRQQSCCIASDVIHPLAHRKRIKAGCYSSQSSSMLC